MKDSEIIAKLEVIEEKRRQLERERDAIVGGLSGEQRARIEAWLGKAEPQQESAAKRLEREVRELAERLPQPPLQEPWEFVPRQPIHPTIYPSRISPTPWRSPWEWRPLITCHSGSSS